MLVIFLLLLLLMISNSNSAEFENDICHSWTDEVDIDAIPASRLQKPVWIVDLLRNTIGSGQAFDRSSEPSTHAFVTDIHAENARIFDDLSNLLMLPRFNDR